jgi:hypothetical protein
VRWAAASASSSAPTDLSHAASYAFTACERASTRVLASDGPRGKPWMYYVAGLGHGTRVWSKELREG